MPDAKKILLVCVENTGRSQMAEDFPKHAPVGYEPQSAGTIPIEAVNLLAISVMKEIRIDISNQRPKTISYSMIRQSSRIVNMGCMDRESRPALLVKDILDCNIQDPKGRSIDEIRAIRNQIEIKVKDLIKSLERRSDA